MKTCTYRHHCRKMEFFTLKGNIYTLCLLVGFICASTRSVHSHKEKFCGTKLVKTLAQVCLAFPTLPPSNKRNNDVDMNDFNWQDIVERPEDSQLAAAAEFKTRPNWMKALFPKYETNGVVDEDYFHEFIPERFILGKRAVGGGIVEECCKRGCTYEYLILNYCDKSMLQ